MNRSHSVFFRLIRRGGRLSALPGTVFLVIVGFTAAALANEGARPVIDFPEELVLIFEDEFAGDALDEAVWRSPDYGEITGMKRETLRGPGNIEVRDGELQLVTRLERREHRGRFSKWTAGYVYMIEPLENNVYLEARLRPGAAAGVNNAFWLAAMTHPGGALRDRYEIDIVEARKHVESGEGRAHLAWHDWKTRAYARNAQGASDHIAQGHSLRHPWGEFQTWGLWYGEEEMIWYLDGREVWRGKTHPRLGDQWWTGVGKLDQWFPNEEKRAYGRYGQEDWLYRGGYTGDRLNLIFSTLPWEASWSPIVEEEVDGDRMIIDYVRIFRPRRLLETEPSQQTHPPGRKATLTPGASWKVELDEPLALEREHPWYFSLSLERPVGGALRLSFEDGEGKVVSVAKAGSDGHLQVGFSEPASTVDSYPAILRSSPFVGEVQEHLLVVRYTPLHEELSGAGAFSLSAFPAGEAPEREPYFYRNVDARGNSSITQGWDINQRGKSTDVIAAVRVENMGDRPVRIGPLRSAASYLAVSQTKEP